MEKIIKGFTCGAMDVFHAGHVLMMEDCKRHCDYLIVGLHTNPQLDRADKNKPVQLRKLFSQLLKYWEQSIIAMNIQQSPLRRHTVEVDTTRARGSYKAFNFNIPGMDYHPIIKEQRTDFTPSA